MLYSPKFKVDRFAQLGFGELFAFDAGGTTAFAIKATDPENDGDPCIALLGPEVPHPLRPASVIPHQEMTAIGFGKDYHICLPSKAAGWSTVAPPDAVPALVLREDKLFFRLSFGSEAGRLVFCLLDLETGRLNYSQRPGIIAFATQFQIGRLGWDTEFHRLATFGPDGN